VPRKDLFDGSACSPWALGIAHPENSHIFFIPDGISQASFPAVGPELAEPSPEFTAPSPWPSFKDLLNCGVNFFGVGFYHRPQNCIYLIDAWKTA
jgi:hypothetical protein